MVEIAKALSMDARVVIMDEPTSSLTLTETGQLLSVIADLRTEGVSIIYISHRLSEIKQIADRVVVLRDGKNAGTLESADIHHDNIVKLMVGRDLEKFYSHGFGGGSTAFAEIRELRPAAYAGTPISFDVRKGEILGIAGLVGAGRLRRQPRRSSASMRRRKERSR
jgi:ribose transport system ATP-binding protein